MFTVAEGAVNTTKVRAVLLLLLSLVAEPHTHLLGEQPQLAGDGFDELAVRSRILLEKLLQGGTSLRREHGALLAFARGASGHQRGRRSGARGGRVLSFCQPLLEHLLDGCGVGRTQLHLLKTAYRALGKVVVALVRQRLPDGVLCVAKVDSPSFELFCETFQLVDEGSGFRWRDSSERPGGGNPFGTVWRFRWCRDCLSS